MSGGGAAAAIIWRVGRGVYPITRDAVSVTAEALFDLPRPARAPRLTAKFSAKYGQSSVSWSSTTCSLRTIARRAGCNFPYDTATEFYDWSVACLGTRKAKRHFAFDFDQTF
jgi:hypothetical protein